MNEIIPLNKESKLGIYLLKDIWLYYKELKTNQVSKKRIEWKYINGVFNALGLGLEPTIQYLLTHNSSFTEFEDWIYENGNISNEIIEYFNSVFQNENRETFKVQEKVLSELDLEQWKRDGYVIVKNAVSKEDCKKTVEEICATINVNLNDTKTWYETHPLKQGIMIQLFNSSILNKNRLSKKIRLAYQQLWQRSDLTVSMDRVSFNPPETKSYQFPDPNLHWDMSLKKPIPFGLQGLLYLSDTNKDQGAFTVIPGFHNKIDSWLERLIAQENPRDHNLLNKFDAKPISGKAGDFIIWNQCLPHGSRPNNSLKPRIVQYINYQPLELESQQEWI